MTSLRLVEEPVPFPVAVLGAVCRPAAVLSPFAEADACLGDVWRPIAWSPAVAEPEPVAPRGEMCTETMAWPDVADAEAVRIAV